MKDQEHKSERKGYADDLRDGKGKPDKIELSRQRKQEGGGDQYDELATDACKQTIDALTKCLTDRRGDDAESREDKAETDGAQGRTTDLQHVRRRVEQPQQPIGEKLKHGKTDQHIRNGTDHGEADRLYDAVPPFRTVVIGNDRDHSTV